MWIASQDTNGQTVYLNTDNVTHIRDDPDEDFLTVYFKYGEVWICRSEKKKLMAALRRIGLEGEGR